MEDRIKQQEKIILAQNAIIAGQTKTLEYIAAMLPSMIPDPKFRKDVEKCVKAIKEAAALSEAV